MLADALLGAIRLAARLGGLNGIAVAVVLLLYAIPSFGNVHDGFFSVNSAVAFQRAARSGVQHIVVQAHLDLSGLPSERELGKGLTSLNRGVARVNANTSSIVVRVPLSPSSVVDWIAT